MSDFLHDSASTLPAASFEAESGDRRVRRSRAALASAITALTFERGYAGLEPNEVAARADVGRSTLYNHFSGLDELLAHSLERHLSVLARCTLKPDLDPALVKLMEHFWKQRAAARTILRGKAAAAISRSLSRKIEAGLLELRRLRRSQADLPASIIAAQISSGQMAALDTWLSGRAPASPDQLARLLHAVTYAAALATL
jgi:AcrR family transcriptional regulator